jgi:hypothetical protein
MKSEKKHAARVLAQERTAADDRLRRQMEHSHAQFREEGQRAQEAEQPAGAWPVQVVPNLGRVGDGTSQLSVAIRNLGNYSITQVEAQLGPDGRTSSP